MNKRIEEKMKQRFRARCVLLGVDAERVISEAVGDPPRSARGSFEQVLRECCIRLWALAGIKEIKNMPKTEVVGRLTEVYVMKLKKYLDLGDLG